MSLNPFQRRMVRRLVDLSTDQQDRFYSVYERRRETDETLRAIRLDIKRAKSLNLPPLLSRSVSAGEPESMVNGYIHSADARLGGLQELEQELAERLQQFDQQLEAMTPDRDAATELANRVLAHAGVDAETLEARVRFSPAHHDRVSSAAAPNLGDQQ